MIWVLIFLFSNCFLFSEPSYVYNPSDWVKCSNIYITQHSPSQSGRRHLILWMNTYSQTLYPVAINYPVPGDWSEHDRWMERYGWIGKSYPDNQWITVSVADRVPDTAKAIYLTGILIITTGNAQESPSMTLIFRRKGETEEFKYAHQVVVSSSPGGARSPMSVWVPLDDNREFEFKWTRSTYGIWPENSAYGISLFLNAWAE